MNVTETKPLADTFDAELLARLRATEAHLGRSLRVLHVGNIANNAFHNATLLQRLGVSCDVLCPDYYHIMGCPEWEEADFDNQLEDQFRPAWTTQDLHGYQRPRWFAQGPQFVAMDYLIARANGDVAKANYLWRRLGIFNRTQASGPLDGLRSLAAETLSWVRRGYNVWNHVARLQGYLEDWPNPYRNPCGVWGARILRLAAPALLRSAVAWQALSRMLGRWLPASSRIRHHQAPLDTRTELLCQSFRAAFPARADQLTPADVEPSHWTIGQWTHLFQRYDIVQGFATSVILPMVANVPYFAFEHGTLREIPFRVTPEGRLTALAYHLAQRVFVTNADCLPNARLIAGDRVSSINHPYDEDLGFSIPINEGLRAELCTALDADFLLFHPTRQDWVADTGYADKGNDIVFRALAALRAQGLRVGAVCCEWGANVVQSQQLAADLGVTPHVRWIKPQANLGFIRMARACGLVVDQFKLGGFGGVTFKSLAAGVPVCTNLDEAAAMASLGTLPPVLRCTDEAELVGIVAALYRDPRGLKTLAGECRAWAKTHHSGSDVIATQLRCYLDFLDGARIADASAAAN